MSANTIIKCSRIKLLLCCLEVMVLLAVKERQLVWNLFMFSVLQESTPLPFSKNCQRGTTCVRIFHLSVLQKFSPFKFSKSFQWTNLQYTHSLSFCKEKKTALGLTSRRSLGTIYETPYFPRIAVIWYFSNNIKGN